ncbi:carbohydrate ABC transporter permease [Cohnella sp. GCM10027633]|uniref:carbohydrate ABC transporter permease n=1 Tax=unclassified Cohnella TaxID=2636738 RepID=UPI00362A0AA9
MKPASTILKQTPARVRGMKLPLANPFKAIWRERVAYLFMTPFLLCFCAFILIPVVVAIMMSFTSYDAFRAPRFVGFSNYISLITQDTVFIKYALPNTIKFAFFVGPIGYMLTFVLAWLVYQLPKSIRDIVTLAIYAPSIAGGVALVVVWQAAFSGDYAGYLNNFLMHNDWIQTPILWLKNPEYLLNVMILVTIWMGFGVGFLAMLAGFDTVNKELYEAGRIDGIANRVQEAFYITIPSMKPQMLFSAVMAIVGTLKAGAISVQLTGLPITYQYAGHLMLNHIDDYAYIRFELGYASMLSVVLLLFSFVAMRLCYRLFGPKEGD